MAESSFLHHSKSGVMQYTLELRAFVLLRQSDLSVYVKAASNDRRSRVRLAAPDAEGVLTASDDGLTRLGDHAQIAILQFEGNLLALARFEMNPLESAKSDPWRARD